MDIHWPMDHQHSLIGSVWFTAGEGQAMVDMIDAGLLDLSPLQHNVFPLNRVNEAISALAAQWGLQRFHHQPTTANRVVAARNHSLSSQTCEGKHHA